jgi:hypothetical protein
MCNVKAIANFYHDSVGARSYGETFVAPSQAIADELARLGYVQEVDSKTADMAQKMQQREQLMGEAQKMTNHAVERANLVENTPAYEMQQQADKMAQQAQSSGQEQQPNQPTVMNTESEEYKQMQQQQQQQQAQQQQAQSAKASARKTTDK